MDCTQELRVDFKPLMYHWFILIEYLAILMVCSEKLHTVLYFLISFSLILIEYLAILIVSTEQLHAGISHIFLLHTDEFPTHTDDVYSRTESRF